MIFGIFFVAFIFSFQISATPKAIIIIRHGEKSPDKSNVNLDQKGCERAAALAPYFVGRDLFKDLKITKIFAQQPDSKDASMRPIETITPTANLLKLPINKDYTKEEIGELTNHILTHKNCDGHVVLICWAHEKIYEMVSLFGVKNHKKKWHGDVFDRTLIINFNGDKIDQYRDLPQRLLYGDSTN
ncbi:hypothetical protein A3F66_04860 [candidate division TM6 bacterium RIFCSPHIGHO2_12_FULL_32_22]|nr:MAG: hypothetical protein A3F66_04860 [candidate division TM6 bacterium RIFCSPHIGHO2_12_FULL_32_22]